MCEWDWSVIGSVVSAIAASGALAITGWPQFSNWLERRSIDRRMDKFFHNEDGKIKFDSLEDTEYCKELLIKDYIITSTVHGIYFYKNQKICLINYKNTPMNSVVFECGFYPYTVISKNCLRIDKIDNSSGVITHAFIQKGNNVPDHGVNFKNFETIINWKE